MTTITLKLPKLHTAQEAIIKAESRYKLICCGRRFGKTELFVHIALNGHSLKTQGALHGLPIAYVSLTEKNVKEFWQRITNTLPNELIKYSNKVDKYIQLVTGGSIECWTFENFVSSRGRAYAGIILDEAAIPSSLKEAWTEVFIAMLADYEGWAILGSTPNGMNYFEQLYTIGQNPEYPEWKSFRFTSYDNPHMKASEFDMIRRQIDENTFNREYLAEFTAGGGSVFILHSSSIRTDKPIYEPASMYVAGVDWGQSDDYTVIDVIDATTYQEVDMLMLRQLSWDSMIDSLVDMCKKWRIEKVVTESNSAGAMNEMLFNALFSVEYEDKKFPILQSFTTTNKSKDTLVKLLQTGLSEELMLLDHAIANSELRAFTTKQAASGVWTYSAPDGLHDDTVMARMLANYATYGLR